jgi:glycosyltransferase involved in cell wall biosynthesis
MTAVTPAPLLSILLISYNHERYIERALESVLAQNLPGETELVVADDASTDRTLEIIRGFEAKAPHITFRFLATGPNLGITRNYQRAFAACTGRFVAVLEGDDYWTNASKLARQVAFLDEHGECDMCATNFYVYEESKALFTPRIPIQPGHLIFGARDLIRDNIIGNFSTCVYRRIALDRLPPALFELRSYDWIVNICVGMHGLIGFLHAPMSVYRLHAGGTWTQASVIERLQIQRDMIPQYDALTGSVLHETFDELHTALGRQIAFEQIGASAGRPVRRIRRLARGVLSFMPPIVLTVVRALVPPGLIQALHRRLTGNNS